MPENGQRQLKQTNISVIPSVALLQGKSHDPDCCLMAQGSAAESSDVARTREVVGVRPAESKFVRGVYFDFSFDDRAGDRGLGDSDAGERLYDRAIAHEMHFAAQTGDLFSLR